MGLMLNKYFFYFSNTRHETIVKFCTDWSESPVVRFSYYTVVPRKINLTSVLTLDACQTVSIIHGMGQKPNPSRESRIISPVPHFINIIHQLLVYTRIIGLLGI